MSMGLYNSQPISQFTSGTAVKATDEYVATDVTDLSQSPSGTTKKYTIQQLTNYLGSFQTVTVTSVSQQMVSNTRYNANLAEEITFTLPPASAVGDILIINSQNTGGFTIVFATGQSIRIGNVVTSLNGNVTSSNQGDSLVLTCTVANLAWMAESGTIGNNIGVS